MQQIAKYYMLLINAFSIKDINAYKLYQYTYCNFSFDFHFILCGKYCGFNNFQANVPYCNRNI